MTRSRKPCYLCERFGPPRGKKHGIISEGMCLDFSCPTSKETYDKDLLEILRSLKALDPDPEIPH